MMSQSVVTKFYSSKKRFKVQGKSLKNKEEQNLSETFIKDAELTAIDAPKGKPCARNKAKVNKVTNYLKPQPKTSKTTNKEGAPLKKSEIPRTPKRNLSNPEELTPSKKKSLVSQGVPVSQGISPGKLEKSSDHLTPKKLDLNARRKLQLGSPNRFMSPRKIASPLKKEVSPQKASTYENINSKDLESLLNESRTKILFSGRIDELKKSLEKFSKVSAKTKEFQSNSYKITSVISSAKKGDNDAPIPVIQGEPAYKKYSYLAAPESHSLILPYKYKLLAEAFRCMDTVVSMLYNRKEKITFQKVQNGVQKMMSKNFLMSHLGQILTVYPSVYTLEYERNDSYVVNKGSSSYQLVITPVFSDENGNTTIESSNKPKKDIKSSFILMTPQHLLERKKVFSYNLTNIVKKHHQDFLTRINVQMPPNNTIVRWHPKFQVDSVPDIQVAALPEEPETKVSTAKDVLNKLRGSVPARVEKALQSVASKQKAESKEENSSHAKEGSSKNDSLNKKQKALKGICTDILEKVRAREAAKMIENMTRSVDAEKRSAMLERLPRMVEILWSYFIAERKAAVPVNDAINKIIYSFNSLITPADVQEHLQLITETMPGWLSFVKIPKGEYITMDKKKNIHDMLKKPQVNAEYFYTFTRQLHFKDYRHFTKQNIGFRFYFFK